ncbi:MAG: TIGR03986 family CRISPR-associated RAMP protein [Tepidanaerobacteraceae bacterium]|nr:TIGR03986 family CRISPR-associated RAMP protein [Tepidanaerobacteraceae bacterium]
MEKAKIINIKKCKNGDFTAVIQFEDGRVIHVPVTTILDMSLNNEECIIERRNRAIMSITVKGRRIFAPQGVNAPKANKRQTTADKHAKIAKESKAHAPYNFIPLNSKVILGRDRPDFDKYHSKPVSKTDMERFNGYIDCRLETITPLYIRDTYTNEERIKREQSDKNSIKKDNPDFFSPGGIAKIPGSSLRGMIRTLVEIMSWGKFGFCDGDKRLFYRAVGDTSALGKYYRQIMIDEQNAYFPKIKAGILKKVDDKYLIYKSKKSETSPDTQIYRVNFDPTNRKVKNTDIALKQFDFKKIYFKPVVPKLHPHKRPKNLKYALVEEISDGEKDKYIEGYLISSGNLGNRKHMHWIIDMPGSDYIDITESIKVYLQDKNRYEEVNFLDRLEKEPAGVPCFYIKTESGEIAVGHTGMFRLPYKYTIGDHIPGYLKQEKNDMAENIFGIEANKKSLASRVFFEDAVLGDGQRDIFVSNEPLNPQILSEPKPTTFQHYLEQNKNGDAENLNHWDIIDKGIRGHKLYWHRDSRDWEYNENEKQREKDEKQLTEIKPIKPGVEFTFRIRFENLTKEELGAMLFALDLPNGCHHKLGMGKPLGLGSVSIKPNLFLIDREKRYTKLFQGDAWNLENNQKETKSFKDAFEQYVFSEIKPDNKTMTSIWDYERMQHLKTMLNWGNTKAENWYKETKYMEIEPKNEFKYRPVLLRPIEEYDRIAKKS